MKATIDIPDELYRQVKSKSALRGQAVREVAIHLFQGWVLQTDEAVEESSTPPENEPVPTWFGAARKYAQHVQQHDMSSIRGSIKSQARFRGPPDPRRVYTTICKRNAFIRNTGKTPAWGSCLDG